MFTSPKQLAATVLLLVGVAPAAATQSLLDHSDNISTDWVGNTGTLYFNFVHRFSSSPAPEHKVTNFPTFLVATGFASQALIGFNYATNSALSANYPNEWEFFGRYAPLQQDDGAPFDIGGQFDYNNAVKGVDADLSLARRDGPIRVFVVGRTIADTIGGDTRRFSYGGGATIRLGRFVALAGDISGLTDPGANERTAWSAGIHIALPNTPHTLSIHMSNANTSTLQGVSRGGDTRRYGFEFTIPVHMNRFFSNPEAVSDTSSKPAAAHDSAKGRAPVPAEAAASNAAPTSTAAPVPTRPVTDTVGPKRVADTTTKTTPTSSTAATAAAKAPAASTTPATSASTSRASSQKPTAAAPSRQAVSARIKGQAFVPSTINVAVGGTVTWKNQDALVHTVTAVDKSFNSGVIPADGTWSYTFNTPGTYAIYCMAHPFMKGTVVVK